MGEGGRPGARITRFKAEIPLYLARVQSVLDVPALIPTPGSR